MRAYRSVLFAAAATALGIGFAASARSGHSELDDGAPIASAWSNTGEFTSLGALGPDNVRFTTGAVTQIRADGDPRTLEQLRFVVKDGRLLVGRRSGENYKLPAATIFVTAPGIRAATLAGSGTISVDRLVGDEVSANVAGSGDLTIGDVSARLIDARVAGSGDLTLRGRSEEAHLAIAGSGRVEGAGFTAGNASAAVAGSGDMAFRSDGSVTASITGSGDVVVTGRASCTQNRTGSGTLRCGA
jgi:hypothetical protein